MPANHSAKAILNFWFSYPTPSQMQLDLRFVLDGNPQPWTRFSAGNPPQPPQLETTFDGLSFGTHILAIQARSVLANGPPMEVRLCGTSDCRFRDDGSSVTNATVTVNAVP